MLPQFQVASLVVSFGLSFFHLSWSSWVSLGLSVIIIGVDLTSSDTWVNPQKGSFSLLIQESDLLVIAKRTSNVVQSGGASSALFIPFVFTLYMPLFYLIGIVFIRRNQALKHLGCVKAHIVRLSVEAIDQAALQRLSNGVALDGPLIALLDDLHKYLHYKRPFTQHFLLPYWTIATSSLPENETMFKLTRDIGLSLMKVHRSIQNLYFHVQQLGVKDGSQLYNQVLQLHISIEQLCCIKEMRTPVMLRCWIRWTGAVIFPVYLGFYSQNLDNVLKASGTLGLLFLFVQWPTLIMLDLLVNLEDPFDDNSIDTISLFEAVDQVAAMCSPVLVDPECTHRETEEQVGSMRRSQELSAASLDASNGAEQHEKAESTPSADETNFPAASASTQPGHQPALTGHAMLPLPPKPS
ncbi:hypothetical protein CEUSTIGMA_g11840.t1 [Chlamydomonas eustigma]|uniref:Uncharacterized protein n=1 Tax=Chlamydomonas eustigma TaxID=1157962 RepID=A0A250XN92_9CHLO|nr:hypothetical protein CEUSTIGMA_g11840.t1 [Chlamydomonas eustigma]|eukprot:GAX84419.1 hypothetical protein CEUSTIGMA_g11840.t1 [Chlamydomonas eustigma]